MSLTSQYSKQDIILTVLKGIVLLDFQDAISVSFADTLFLNKDVLYLASALCKYYISRFLLKNVQVGRKPQQEKTYHRKHIHNNVEIGRGTSFLAHDDQDFSLTRLQETKNLQMDRPINSVIWAFPPYTYFHHKYF